MQQRQASAHTIASYRDTFRLLLQFAQKRLRKAPSTLALEDIDAPLVVDFLDELEKISGDAHHRPGYEIFGLTAIRSRESLCVRPKTTILSLQSATSIARQDNSWQLAEPRACRMFSSRVPP